jgi:hypothetical protein
METTRSRPTANLRVIAMPPTMTFIRALLPVVSVVALVGCGATTATTSVSSPTPTPDMAAARTAALTTFFALPGQAPEVWVPCSSRASDFADCPFSAAVKARLADLGSSGYFADAPPGVCGEDYITGTQNGLNTAPQVLSAVADASGSVTVVIQRGPPPPNFTVTMTLENGLWLASDLASGTGPAASILSAKPNC